MPSETFDIPVGLVLMSISYKSHQYMLNNLQSTVRCSHFCYCNFIQKHRHTHNRSSKYGMRKLCALPFIGVGKGKCRKTCELDRVIEQQHIMHVQKFRANPKNFTVKKMECKGHTNTSSPMGSAYMQIGQRASPIQIQILPSS